MLTIEIKGRRKLIPDCWEEATPLQIKTYLEFYYLRVDEIFNVDDEGKRTIANADALYTAKSALLYSLLGIKPKWFRRIGKKQIARLIDDEKLIDFFFTGDFMYTNKYPLLYRWFKKLCGPIKFNHLSFEEFGYAEAYYNQYKITSDESALNMFVATLYRPYNGKKRTTPDVECRQKFDSAIIENALPIVAPANIYTKLCVVLWYEHGRAAMAKMFNHVFDKKSNIKPQKFDPLGWEKVVSRLSAHNPAQFNSVAHQSVYRVFAAVQNIISENIEIERRMKAK